MWAAERLLINVANVLWGEGREAPESSLIKYKQDLIKKYALGGRTWVSERLLTNFE